MKKTITLQDLTFEHYISEEKIAERIAVLGTQLSQDYAQQCPIILGVLNGAFVFAADLMRAIKIDCELSFIKLSSYEGTQSSGKVATKIGLDIEVKDRPVIVVEDIVDSGRTLHSFLPYLRTFGPSSICLATFLFKPDALVFDVQPDYIGFEIPSNFVVGYGLDYNGLGRNLPALYTLQTK